MKFCPNCNSQLSDDAKFCTGCGAHLSNDTAGGMQQPFSQPTAPVMEEIVPPVIDDNTFQQPLSAPAQPVVQQSIQGGFQQPQDLRQTFDTQAQFQPRQGFASQQQSPGTVLCSSAYRAGFHTARTEHGTADPRLRKSGGSLHAGNSPREKRRLAYSSHNSDNTYSRRYTYRRILAFQKTDLGRRQQQLHIGSQLLNIP